MQDGDRKRKAEEQDQIETKERKIDDQKDSKEWYFGDDLKFQFRPATEKDRQSIVSLIIEVLLEYKIFPDRDHARNTLTDIKKLQREYLDHNIFMVLETMSEDKEIVGTIAFTGKPKKRIAELKRFYLTKKYRGKGIGKRMLKEGLQMCNDKWPPHVKILLQVAKAHTEAINLYQKFGFIQSTFEPSGKAAADFFMELP